MISIDDPTDRAIVAFLVVVALYGTLALIGWGTDKLGGRK